MHGTVGSVVSLDLVVRGDRYSRRARAFTSHSTSLSANVSFIPENAFQLVPGAYNRVVLKLSPKISGTRYDIYCIELYVCAVNMLADVTIFLYSYHSLLNIEYLLMYLIFLSIFIDAHFVDAH